MTGWLRSLCLITLGLVAALQTGCVAAVAGVAGAGAVAGYMYYNGLLYRDYRANLADTLTAVRSALGGLKFTIESESAETGSATVLSRTVDGHTIRVHLDVTPGPTPGDPAVTRVGIRVGFSGDEVVSARILDEISRLMPAAGIAPVATTPVLPPAVPAPAAGVTSNLAIQPITPPQPIPAQTSPPPLAPASGVSSNGRLVPIPAGSPPGPR